MLNSPVDLFISNVWVVEFTAEDMFGADVMVAADTFRESFTSDIGLLDDTSYAVFCETCINVWSS